MTMNDVNSNDLRPQAAAMLRTLRVRVEPGGRHVTFLPGTGRYVFVNQPGAEILQRLAAGKCLADACSVHFSAGWSVSDAYDFIDEVLGAREAGVGAPDSPVPSAWTLAAELGAAADRCDTFGMPL
jgi:hypothetical protein